MDCRKCARLQHLLEEAEKRIKEWQEKFNQSQLTLKRNEETCLAMDTDQGLLASQIESQEKELLRLRVDLKAKDKLCA